MCNLYRLGTSRAEYQAYFAAREDERDALTVDKNYAAPGKPGYVVRQSGGERVLSTMKWGVPDPQTAQATV